MVPGGGGSRAADGRRLPRAAGACTFGRLLSISRHVCGPAAFLTLRMGKFSHAREDVAFRVQSSTRASQCHLNAVRGYPQGKGPTTTWRPATPSHGHWLDGSFSALQPDQRRDLCRLCLPDPERPTPAVFSYQKNRHGPAASACKLKSMMEKMIFHTKFYETPHGSAKSIF